MPPFDACIDLTMRTVPEGIAPPVAVERVRSAVEELPGAEWISVEWCGDAPGDWLRVFPAGVGREQEDGEWAELAERITATVHEALGADRRP